jgi:hypothetical protein
MIALYILLGILCVIYIALTGFALMVNFFSARGNSFWASIFHRCTTLDKIMLSPGLIWVLPLVGASYAIRAVSKLRK